MPLRLALPVLAVALALVAPADAGAAAWAWHLDGDGPLGVVSAQRVSTGTGVLVAVVDSGVDPGHPALATALWRNPGEIPGNHRDDDRNGYVDDVSGWDFVAGDGDPSDDNGHGTFVAGVVAAAADAQVPGVAPAAAVLPVRVLDRRGLGDEGDVADGVRYAVDRGARVVNLSLATLVPGRRLRAAIRYARRRGALVVAAAGNFGRSLARHPAYPATWREPNVIAVAAAKRDGSRLGSSSYGSAVDLAAPGEAVLGTALGGWYEERSGSSVAAPMVSGTAALIASAHPTAGWRELRAALLSGARPGPRFVAAGALDAAGALAEASAHTRRFS